MRGVGVCVCGYRCVCDWVWVWVYVGGCMQACSCDMNTTFDFLDVVIPFVGLIVNGL